MTLSAGSRLGPYEILAPLGAGGMGEVYRARDSRLSREVAIKVLPAELASDAERLKRFEKEARSASALNHPNIVTIYDIGSEGGVSYIAMERVEGATLREQLSGGALPMKKLLHIAPQIAEGLAKAHEAGIVHRDLKPENVMVTKDGLVKILDFGLAKLTSTMSGSGEGSQLPTMTGTTPGVIVGTVGYMSPEQASGAALDFRSDQFSFGSILYEMATGRKAFQKKTAIDTLAAILNEEPPPIGALNAGLPAPLQWIVERCLAKDPEGRYASTKDLAHDLATVRDRLGEATSSGQIAAPGPVRRRSLAPLAFAALAAVLAAAAAFWLGRRTGETPPPSFRRLTFRRGTVMNARFLPDGQSVVYSASWDGNPPGLFTTRLDSQGFLRLNLPTADIFAVSRSGELAIGIGDSMSTLARVALSGGGPREVAENVPSADWSPDGESLAVARRVSNAMRLEYPIGHKLYETTGWIHAVRVSPDGQRVAFADHPGVLGPRGSVGLVDRAGKKTTLTKEIPAMMALAWAPSGDEIWYSAPDDSFRAVSLSGRERVVMRTAGGGGIEDIFKDGRALLSLYSCRSAVLGVPAGETHERDLSWQDQSAARDLSADGKTLLFGEPGKGAESTDYVTYLRRLDGSEPVRLGVGSARTLSPDGKWALVVVNTTPPRLEMLATGAGEKRSFERGEIMEYRYANWFPDGRRIFFTGLGRDGQERIYVQSIDGGPPEPISEPGIRAAFPVSPDGRFLLARLPDRSWHMFEVSERKLLALHGVEPAENPIRFTADGNALFVEKRGKLETSVYRVDLRSGRRELHLRVTPADAVGIESLGEVRITPDGRSYVYSIERCLSDLYLVEGLR